MLSSRSSLWLWLSFLTLAAWLNPHRVWGQEAAGSPASGAAVRPVALIVVLPLEGSPEENLGRVLASVLRLELEKRGLQTLLFASTDEEALVADLLEGREPGIAALMRALAELSPPGDRDFLAAAGYIRVGEEIQVEFGITDAAQGRILGQASVRAAVDFSLDDVMIRAIGRLLEPAEERIAEAVRQKAEQAAAAQVPPKPGKPPQAGEEGGEVSQVPVQEIFPKERSRFRRLEFSVGFAPFIPLGAASETLEVGFMPFAYLDYRIPTAAGILGVGLSSGLNMFSAGNSGLASYFRYVIPAGVDVRFSGPEAVRLGMFVRGGAGAAFNVSSFDKLPADLRDDLSRVLPYVYGGIGAKIGFSDGVGMALDVLYKTYAYLYQESAGGKLRAEWIMGVLPSLYIFTRL